MYKDLTFHLFQINYSDFFRLTITQNRLCPYRDHFSV